MKLLLTSKGLSNESIARALFELVGKKPEETTLAFIPTAMNVARGSKDWFINDLSNIERQGLKFIDIVDISALPRKVWEPRLKAADVLFFSGGNPSHLMYWLKESGLKDLLPELLQDKVYVGLSAGSMVTNPTLAAGSADKKKFYADLFGYESEDALGFVDFYTRPHFNSPRHPYSNEVEVKKLAEETKVMVYGLDDMSALKVVDGKVEIISEGECIKI